MVSKRHWEQIYSTKPVDGVSWFQLHAEESLRLIEKAGIPFDAEIIDVGGGASTLAADLLSKGHRNLTVLDLSGAALEKARAGLGEQSMSVRWLEGDITQVELPPQTYDVWHDRAVFHFLTEAGDRRAYVAQLLRAAKPGGHVIVATFAEDGPLKCSGLPVVRYSPAALQAELGSAFELITYEREEHHTPFGTQQKFVHCLFRKQPK
ncbi:MAG: class I SAM-dependent methyltransferase [Sinobacteraceae bacterium]|nr:class I SAM-dependent methyltransferase [Nevskiaceae bacterium]